MGGFPSADLWWSEAIRQFQTIFELGIGIIVGTVVLQGALFALGIGRGKPHSKMKNVNGEEERHAA